MVSKHLAIISAPSGTGKNTIVNALLKKKPLFKHSISTTSRKPRPREIDGVHYHFCSKEEFEKKIREGVFLEYATVFEHYYGTTKTEIEKIQKKNYIPILDVDVNGFQQIRKQNPDAISIFISPPGLKELKRRLLRRATETEEQVRKRLKIAKQEMKYQHLYDYVIVNDHLETSVEQLESILHDYSKRIGSLNF